MQNLQAAFIQCPYCWQPIEVLVDGSVPNQEYIEDCRVCCRPIVIVVASVEGEITCIDARREDD